MTNVQNNNTYLYFLDDDNIIHPNLYKFLNTIGDEKCIYTFIQNNHGNLSKGNRLHIGGIDTAMFLIHFDLCKDIRWNITKHEADGIFFLNCYNNNKDKHKYIENELCYYNYLN
jgi:hypothetical protein